MFPKAASGRSVYEAEEWEAEAVLPQLIGCRKKSCELLRVLLIFTFLGHGRSTLEVVAGSWVACGGLRLPVDDSIPL